MMVKKSSFYTDNQGRVRYIGRRKKVRSASDVSPTAPRREKELQFITRDGQVVPIGGPSAGGGSTGSGTDSLSIREGESLGRYASRLLEEGLQQEDFFERYNAAREKLGIPIPVQRKPPRERETIESAAEKLGLDVDKISKDNQLLSKIEADWLQGVNPTAKEDILEMYSTFPDVRNARLMLLRDAIGSNASFDEFLDTPIEVWRGSRPTFEQTFSSFTLSRGVAEDFARSRDGYVYKATIRPKDLVGYAPTGASELFVPQYGFTTDNIVQIEQAYEIDLR